ncbi:hypothetical protein PHYBLDRAFT_169914 [Phycomyces blakesleeanus NRRL 1555(-)]|uniref:Uncharacterized protein n=1 Tax=Phycomyces blakesleeanus (strain ATCC 8743b / DSM 1359 / FGSC 10004 / NBRC 33097 / NRRL 1555) TaxID=763407 RepID=A0A162PQK6_PHYB8|nr:hypothetical protein PHYBLDRAFT_169914 [Phycomyces blakesleeanus NRRL 1555(-)]OAD72006.1 hypothetical protein PHYBLDRAFT_169914 [Phycomyces blakesleeanus NRRL 1555(-)]|eukprot:XP_018290046.1 hypothetical protein PHYBLDRAFT_169914 [Phycomyces blakesleeanus NRRL 1555(-)]
MPGLVNDINVLERSPLFEDLAGRQGLVIKYTVNGNQYKIGYYLTDGIYPAYAAFVKSFNDSQSAKEKNFAKVQEAAQKDVEKVFGVLQLHFAIVAEPARMWKHDTLKSIMTIYI